MERLTQSEIEARLHCILRKERDAAVAAERERCARLVALLDHPLNDHGMVSAALRKIRSGE